MRWMFVYIVLLAGIVGAEPPVQAQKKSAVAMGEREKLLYETECKRAEDLVQAYGALKAGLDDEHTIVVVFKDGKAMKKNHAVVSVQRFGALLNCKFQHVEDEDVWYAQSLQVNSIDHFLVVKKP